MLKAYSRERMEVFEAVGVMLGSKKVETDAPGTSIGEIDTAAIDRISAGHMDRLKNEAKVGKKN